MPILRDIQIALTASDIMPGSQKRRVHPQLMSRAEEMIALGATLWQPAAVYVRLQVHRVDGEHVYLLPVGWPLRGQRELCSLLPLDEIGVHLNKYYVLEPHKSFSSLIGLGPGYESGQVGSICKYCALRDTCWRRREEPS